MNDGDEVQLHATNI